MEELDALLRAGGDGAAILRHIRLNKVRPLCGCVWGGMAVTGRRDCCRLASALCSNVCVCVCPSFARSTIKTPTAARSTPHTQIRAPVAVLQYGRDYVLQGTGARIGDEGALWACVRK